LTSVYVCGAWTEQHFRARPMIAKLREAALTISHDWTQAEGDVCACGHPKSHHSDVPVTGSYCCDRCPGFNGIGVGGDSGLSPADRKRFAQADLDGVLSADIVWLLAANDKGACGGWVELGAALAAQECRRRQDELEGPPSGRGPLIIVSGPRRNRTIFTDLADVRFDDDEKALGYILLTVGRDP